jgi:hypothetical protein
MERGKVYRQIKLPTGAASMLVREKYPHAAATIQPTNRPRTTAQLFMIGEPNLSQKMIVTNTRNPSPIYSALPQGSA